MFISEKVSGKVYKKMKRADTNLGLRQSNFNGDSNVKRTCLPPPAVGQGTGRMAQCRMHNAN